MMSKTIRDVTFELLRDLGITTIFGNPGSTEESFLQNFPEDFRYIETLQEAAAVGMADGYAQATKKVGLVNVHTSVGVSNAMSNIYTAAMNKTPLIITAGNQTREMLVSEPWLTNIDPQNLPKPFVKWSYQPARAEDVPAAFMRAYATALMPPAGPVFLSIPLDDWNKPALETDAVLRSVASKVAPDPDRLREFATIISEAKNPVLVYGADIARGDGWDEAILLAEKLHVPVWAAPACERAPFPENHPLYIGGLPFAKGLLSEKLEGYDVVLVIGASVFRYYPYVEGSYIPEGTRLLHITDDPYEASKAPVGDSLISDAVLALKALIEEVKVTDQRSLNIVKQSHRMAPFSSISDNPKNGLLTPLELFEILRESAPEDTILVEESPSNLSSLHQAWPIEFPDSFYTFASGSLGWGLPASIGLALAEQNNTKKRPVLAVIGDGSLQYTIQSLWTAAQQQLPVVFVVPVNKEYAILKSFAKFQNNPSVPGLDIPGIDITCLAKGYGCEAVYVQTAEEVRRVSQEAFKKNVPTVISVPVSSVVPTLI